MTTRDEPHGLCMKRREFLLATGATAATVLISIPGCEGLFRVQTVRYPRKRIAALAELQTDAPAFFTYPDDNPETSRCMIVKLGTQAGAGVGPDRDIVAFHTLCPHMGGPLMGTYKKQFKGLGPCPLHLTTFDLTRHGIVVAGHSTQSLPQILLEVEGDDIYGTGVLGLLYGRAANVS